MKLKIALSIALIVAIPALVSADSLSIGQEFHQQTSFGDKGAKAESPTFGKQIPLYKEYPNATKLKLPAPTESDFPLEKAIAGRMSIRKLSDKPLTLPQLSRLLLSADGLTRRYADYAFRSAPSGGALYPIDIYIIAANIDSLTSGLYHFQVSDSSLELVKPGDFNDSIHHASNGQAAVGSSALTVVMTARFDRITAKYADRGYRYAYIEAGSICQNIYLQATALGLGTVAVGAFNDDALNKLLEIDGVSEAALLIMPVGIPQGK